MSGEIRIGDRARHIGSAEDKVLGPAVVLAIDQECIDPRGAAWIRYDPRQAGGHFRYRSVDLADLEKAASEQGGDD